MRFAAPGRNTKKPGNGLFCIWRMDQSVLCYIDAMNTDELIRRLPKAELHMHIEGSLEPELLFALAERNGIALPHADVDALRSQYEFNNLQSFLDIYYQGVDVLRQAQDFYDLAWAYFARAHADGVVHAEIFFDPQSHTDRGVDLDVVIEGLHAACTEAQARWGISSHLIACFLRHLPESAALDLYPELLRHRERVVGIGLDSSEMGHPPEKFQRLFARAAADGFKRVAHAGEEGPAAYVRQALDLLQVDRIDHGNRALEDPELTAELARRRVPLTVCPLSNLKLCVVDALENHPLRRMLEAGLMVTVNSDDPAYFGGYVNDNFRRLSAALNLRHDELVTLARHSIEASFMPADEMRRHLRAIDALAETH